MAYGIAIFNSSSTLTLDTSFRTARLIYTVSRAGSSSGSISLASLSFTTAFAIAYASPYQTLKQPHSVYMSGKTLVYQGSSSDNQASNSVIYVYAVD